MRAEVITAFTASLLINVAGIAVVDRAALDYGHSYKIQLLRQKTAEKLGATHFEFVESSPQEPLRVPFKNGRMSDRDSVSQDLTQEKEKEAPEDSPKIEREGPVDQLEQERFDPSKAPTAPLSPSAVMSRAVQSLTGRDRITTQAISRARSHGAQVYGRTSFEATGSGMGRYMREMKEKIWLAWFPYLAFHYPKDFRSADAVISFKLDSKGQLRDIRVSRSEGSMVFAAFCVEAIQRASPFGDLPDEILDLTGKDELEAQFVFHFW